MKKFTAPFIVKFIILQLGLIAFAGTSTIMVATFTNNTYRLIAILLTAIFISNLLAKSALVYLEKDEIK